MKKPRRRKGILLDFEIAHVKIALAMEKIAAMLVPGTKLTLLARQPDDDRADICVSDDELADILAMVRRCKRREDSGVRPIMPNVTAAMLMGHVDSANT